jgi:hypothetical protein
MRHVHITRDAVFEEDKVWPWDKEDFSDEESFTMEYISAGSTSQGGIGA